MKLPSGQADGSERKKEATDGRAPHGSERKREGAAGLAGPLWLLGRGAAAGPAPRERRRGGGSWADGGSGPKERKRGEGGKRNFSRMVWSLGNFEEMQMVLNSNFKHCKSYNKICKGMNAQTGGS